MSRVLQCSIAMVQCGAQYGNGCIAMAAGQYSNASNGCSIAMLAMVAMAAVQYSNASNGSNGCGIAMVAMAAVQQW